eukprot:356058-Chlamydomonas_euryale.AAC.4
MHHVRPGTERRTAPRSVRRSQQASQNSHPHNREAHTPISPSPQPRPPRPHLGESRVAGASGEV